jgi:hypothetical protein
MNKEHDAFISHSSNDKRYFVRPLADKLIEYGANIWYDEFSLKAGQSLSRSIEKGISKSNYGILILSKSFFNKQWTEYELRALNSIEVNNPGIIIPVWYKVDIEEVRNFSPYLADKLAIVYSNKTSIDNIALSILETIREDLFESINTKKAWQEMLADAKAIKSTGKKNLKDFKIGPIRHTEFPMEWINRVRMIRNALLDVYPHSVRHWLGGFQRDLHPDDEIQIWERIANYYNEAIVELSIKSKPRKKDVFKMILATSISGNYKENIPIWMSKSQLDKVLLIMVNPIPPFDINDKEFGE